MAEEEDSWNPAYGVAIKLNFDDQPPRELTETEIIRRQKLTSYVTEIVNVNVNETERGSATVTLKPEDSDLEAEVKEHLGKRGYFISVNKMNDVIAITAMWQKGSSFTMDCNQIKSLFSDILKG